MTAKRTTWGTGVSVGFGGRGVSVGFPVAAVVAVGRTGVWDGVSLGSGVGAEVLLGAGEGSGVAVGSGSGGEKLQPASRKATNRGINFTQIILWMYRLAVITLKICIGLDFFWSVFSALAIQFTSLSIDHNLNRIQQLPGF